jgi:hypothetical protein
MYFSIKGVHCIAGEYEFKINSINLILLIKVIN